MQTRILLITLSLWITIAFTGCVTTGTRTDSSGGPKTEILDKTLAKRLLGTKPFSLQWISWDDFGEVKINNENGLYTVHGEQRGLPGKDYVRDDGLPAGEDFVRIDGVITRIETGRFYFDGKITVRVHHINNGQPYDRTGDLAFFEYGNRRFWRLQQMEDPDGAVDYVDIYEDMAAATAEPSY